MKQRSKTVAIVAVIFILGFFYVLRLLNRPLPPLPPLPMPNGYDDFVAAATLLQGTTIYPPLMSPEELREVVTTNTGVLSLARTGLTRHCSIHTEEMMKSLISTIPAELPALKRLAHFMDAAGRFAEIEGRTNEAAKIYLDCARVGNEASRGGVGINRLTGLAVEAIGIARIKDAVLALNFQEAQEFSKELLKLDAGAVSIEETMDLESRFMRVQLNGKFNPVFWAGNWWNHWKRSQTVQRRNEMASARRRLIAIELQLRCLRSKTGKVPETLEALVPVQLNSLPLDPFSEKNFVYRAQGTNWLLYSIGPDGTDDGGLRTNRLHVNRGDLFFDSP